MNSAGVVTLLIIALTVLVSYRGFTNRNFFRQYEFEVEKILVYKEYIRLISSGFLHINWMHLIFNMLSLYFFSGAIELVLGTGYFLLLYLVCLVGSSLLSLFIHRTDPTYSAVGASGAVIGVMFASIALFPGLQIGLFFLPISFPAWVYGLAYVIYSIYGVRSRRDNVGHDAHLGGGLIGLLLAIAIRPGILIQNTFAILIIALPTIIFMWIIIRKPQLLLVENTFFKKQYKYTIDQRYNLEKVSRQKELDRLLEKIHQHGMKSLTKKEKQNLARYSKTTDS